MRCQSEKRSSPVVASEVVVVGCGVVVDGLGVVGFCVVVGSGSGIVVGKVLVFGSGVVGCGVVGWGVVSFGVVVG